MKLRNIWIIAVCVSLVVVGCKKDEEEPIDTQTTASQDNSTAQNIFQDIKRVVEEAATDEGQSNQKKTGYSFGNCATVSISPAWTDTIWPKVLTIDFGSTNCTGNYGVNRRGKLVITMTGRYRDEGSEITVQPDNYYVNDHKIEGTKKLTNNGRNSSNNLTYTINVTNGKLTYPNGDIAYWESTRTNEWVAGEGTTLWTDGFSGICDDEYLITGSATGVNRNGLSYTVNITSALKKKVCCRWIVSGRVDIEPNGLLTRTIDFGSGSCDALATITINGNSFTIPFN